MAAHPSAKSAEGWGTRVRGWERVGHPPTSARNPTATSDVLGLMVEIDAIASSRATGTVG